MARLRAPGPWLFVGVLIAVTLMWPAARLPGDSLGLRRFRAPALGGEVRLSQTFEMTTDGLRAVSFRPARVGDVQGGAVRLSISEVTPSGYSPISEQRVSVSSLVAEPVYRFAFTPVQSSRLRVYRLEIASDGDAPAQGVGVWATRGERYPRGSLFVNDSERWADMAFAVEAPNAPIWRALLSMPKTALGVSRGAIVIVALVLLWTSLGLLFRELRHS